RACLRPHRRQSELQRGDAAPGAEEVALIAQFHGRRARGMVGGDEVDGGVAERGPKLLAVLAFAERRGALELRCAAGDLFGCEREVMRTSFDRHAKAVYFCLTQLRQCVRGREMYD